jgi:REP element-mobilizing transposase RayT
MLTLKGFDREGDAMPQSLARVYLHIVFSTKNRTRFLQNERLRQELHAYLAGTCKNLDSPPVIVGGVDDHVHVLCTLSRLRSIAELVREIKRESSKWLKSKAVDLRSFYWQGGYGVFSISPAHVAALRTYIGNQEEHHRKETFQDEFRRLLRKYGIAYDERYVWD